MNKGIIYLLSLALGFTVVNSSAQITGLKSYVKISDTSGNFSGTLSNGDNFGGAEGIGDLDGDGIEDVAVTAPLDDDGATDAGAIWILFLDSNSNVKSYQKISNSEGGLGNIFHTHEYVGYDIANLGDLDGDGVVDIAVGAPFSNNSGTKKGTVYILFLNTNGTVKSVQEIRAGVAGFTATIDYVDYFGESVANIGDLNGDGIVDIAVGARGDDDGGAERGAVYILFLDTNGTVKSYQKISDTQGNFTGTLNYNVRFGSGIENIGDLNRDGVVDILVGSPWDDDGGTDRGAAWILFLDTNGTVKSHQKISDTQGNFGGVLDNSDLFGVYNLFVGDIDKDGYDNILVTAQKDDDGGTDRGAVWLLNLNLDGTVRDEFKISDSLSSFSGVLSDGDRFGNRISLLGDINNDGIIEIAVAAPGTDDGGTDRGAFYIIAFDLPFFVNYTTTLETPDTLGSIELTPISGTPPYYYFWDDGDQSQNRYNLESGLYGVTVIDSLNDSISFVIPVDVEVQIADSQGVTFDNRYLEKTAADNWGNGKMSFSNVVKGDGAVRVEVINDKKEWTFGYRLSANSQAVYYDDLDFGFYINSGDTLYTWNKSTSTLTNVGSIASGDILSIEREGGLVTFKKNDVFISEVSVSVGNEYRADFTLFSTQTRVKVFIIRFPFWLTANVNITNSNCNIPNTNTGEIDLNVIGGTPSYTYSWTGPNGFTASTQDISNLEVGAYTVTVTDSWSTPNSIIKTYYVGHKVEWTNIVASIVNDNTLIRNTVIYDEPSGASSVNILKSSDDGWAEFEVNSNQDENEIFGLSEIDVNQSLNSVDYGIYLFKSINLNPISSSQLVTVWENGVDMGVLDPVSGEKYFTTYKAGDKFKVQKTGNTITYLKNEVVFYTSTVPVPSAIDLIVDAAMFGVNGTTILEAITSFRCVSLCDIELSFQGDDFEITPLTGGGFLYKSYEHCPDDIIPITVQAPVNYNISDYILSWSQVSPTVGTFFNCQNPNVCSEIILYPNANGTYIFELNIAAYLNSDLNYCSLNKVELFVECASEQPSDDEEIIGCIFGNFGAGVYVNSGTNLNVYCNLLNELGSINTTTNLIEKGEFRNKGDINVSKEWINNAGILFITQEGITDLIGDNQKMKGNSSTHFNKLELGEYSQNSAVKSIMLDQYAHDTLDLVNSELATEGNVFYVKDDNVYSVSRLTGFVSTDQPTGYLSREMVNTSNDAYLFPMGSKLSNLRYRPIEIAINPDPLNTVYDEMKVNFQNHNPFDDGLTTLSPAVSSVNDKYYHKINSTNTSQQATDINIKYYFLLNDGNFQSIAHWEPTNPFWETTPGQNSSLTPVQGLVYAESDGTHSFDEEPYVLAQAGFVVGTGNFPATGNGNTGTSGPNGPGASNGCVANFTYTLYGNQVVLSSTSVVSSNATYTWDLGDGYFASGAVYTHTYAASGTYTVVLTITDGVNTCSSPATFTVIDEGTNVGSPGNSGGSSGTCTASFSSMNYNPQVTFENTSTGLISPIFTWDFGDGNSSTGGPIVVHTYANNGTFTVTLTIVDGANTCTTTQQVIITNNSGIVIEINPANPTNPCGTGGNIGTPTGTGPGSGSNGNNTSTPNTVPCDYVMTITTNDDCRLDGEIYFRIKQDLSLEFITYRPNGMAMPAGGPQDLPELSPEVYDEIPGVPGFVLTGTPEEIYAQCINSVKVEMGVAPFDDFVLDLGTSEDIVITTPVDIQSFKIFEIGNPTAVYTDANTPSTPSNGQVTILSSALSALTSNSYRFELEIMIGASSEIIEGHFIVK